MDAFEFEHGSASDFIDRVRAELADRGLGDYVTVRQDGGDLVVGFRWMGSSDLRYRIEKYGPGFRAELSGQRISAFHAPFKRQFEERFESVVEVVGARTIKV